MFQLQHRESEESVSKLPPAIGWLRDERRSHLLSSKAYGAIPSEETQNREQKNTYQSSSDWMTYKEERFLQLIVLEVQS